MNLSEMMQLIRDGVPADGNIWADFGAGTGNFSLALSTLLGPQATIYAVDRDARALRAFQSRIDQAKPAAHIQLIHADFTQSLALPALDGILLANALHFVRDQAAMLAACVRYLQPSGRVLIVEYQIESAQRWVPYPLPLTRLTDLAPAAGLIPPVLVGSRRSPSTGIVLAAAVAIRNQNVSLDPMLNQRL